jgi:dimethylaniline monooxygenase (N-oxide forming)
VAVIGAGSSGITVLKALRDAGLEVECFERGEDVGGNWVYGGRGSACYASLHANTSRQRMQYADFPMPDDMPAFPPHARVRDYFSAYVDRFALREHIRFGCSVDQATLQEDGTWRLTLEDGSESEFDFLVAAHGHYSRPLIPDFPGSWEGRLLHSHEYREPSIFAGRKVIVVGMGNSAMDIACDAVPWADRVHLVARHGVHIVPKLLFGIPYDMLPNHSWIPLRLRRVIFGAMVRLAVGRPQDHGLPAPDHQILSVHPTISADLLNRVAHGDIHIKPAIRQLEGTMVRFEDGSQAQADVLVCCTGYASEFPFLENDYAGDGRPRLFQRMLEPSGQPLAFIGLLQPLGPVMPIAELQGRLLADYLTGRYRLPDRREVDAEIERDRRQHARRFRRDSRHALEVDAELYKRDLVREHQRGLERAQAGSAPGAPATAPTPQEPLAGMRGGAR